MSKKCKKCGIGNSKYLEESKFISVVINSDENDYYCPYCCEQKKIQKMKPLTK
ncbi:MAG: protein-disulfide isomerase [Spirosomataceae bacterium]|jgi:protein-disulfide isomerase